MDIVLWAPPERRQAISFFRRPSSNIIHPLAYRMGSHDRRLEALRQS